MARGLIGGTVAFAFVGTMAIAGYWFKPSQYALLAGVLQASGMSGAIFGQALLRHVVEAFGWRASILGMAVIAVMLALLIVLLVPRRNPTQKKSEQTFVGLLNGLCAVAKNAQTWLCAFIGFGMAATMLGFGGLWAVPWLRDVHGYSAIEAASMTAALFAGWALFSPLIGWASDKIGRRNLPLLMGAILSLVAFAWLVLATPGSTWSIIALFFLTGVGGSAMTVAFSSVKELNDPRFSSTSLGLMNMCIVGSGAVMQPLIGYLLDVQWKGAIAEGARIYHADAYTQAFVSFLVANAFALGCALLLRETHCRGC